MTDFDRVSDYIKAHRADWIELESLLTSHKALAPENGGDGEKDKCDALESWLRAHGITDITRFNAPDKRVSAGVRPSLAATVAGKSDEYALWSIAHTDVVPVGNEKEWHSDPWCVTQKGNKLYGRGTEDNQQGLVSGVAAAVAFKALGIQPAHTFKLLFAADEECGSAFGIIWLLDNEKLFRKQDLIVIPDGGDAKGETIEVAEKNILWLQIHTVGAQAHGSRPDQGHNACLAASALALRLNALETVFDKHDDLFEPPYSTFQPTKHDANVPAVNMIPGDDVLCFDCRILPCYPLKEVRAEVKKCAAEIGSLYGVHFEITEPQAAESPATPVDAPVVTKLAAALKAVHGIKAKTIGIGGGTVGADLRKKGYNAAVWSTLDDKAHQVDEYCIPDNLEADACTLAYMALN